MSLDNSGRDPFAKTYRHVCDQLASGAYAPGERITVADLASKLGVSQTPVREALSRLAGERLIRDRRGDGYYAAELSGDDIAGLYILQGAYLEAALRGFGKSHHFSSTVVAELELKLGAGDSSSTPVLEAFFDHIVAARGNRVLTAAARNTAARLRPVSHIEHSVLAEFADERRELLNLWQTGLPSSLKKSLVAYHRRRARAAYRIASALRASSPTKDMI